MGWAPTLKKKVIGCVLKISTWLNDALTFNHGRKLKFHVLREGSLITSRQISNFIFFFCMGPLYGQKFEKRTSHHQIHMS